MSRHFPIRNIRSEGPSKPRICDFVITDDGGQMIEFKDRNVRRQILWQDLKAQVEKVQAEIKR